MRVQVPPPAPPFSRTARASARRHESCRRCLQNVVLRSCTIGAIPKHPPPYAEVAKRVPQATLCLLSALVFHEITTQSPASVWIALSKGARTPALASPSLRIVRLSGPSLAEGIDKHQVEGVTVRVYSAAKTVADCFKFRNKIGLDVAIEALKDCLRQKRASIDEIYRYAKVCRVSNVIRPYMEAL
jgi:predicted transcriptional regulator of viral defense system